MARRILAFIEREYPGFIWTVKVNLDGKYQGAAISLPVLLPPHTYNVIPARYLCTENDMKRACLEAAGNLLERYKIPRSPMRMLKSHSSRRAPRPMCSICGVKVQFHDSNSSGKFSRRWFRYDHSRFQGRTRRNIRGRK